MRVLVLAYGSRGCVEPVVARAVRVRARGAEVRVCAPPDEGDDPLVMRGVMAVGGWR
jgi:vancomycin aglycone glucosyltransferase